MTAIQTCSDHMDRWSFFDGIWCETNAHLLCWQHRSVPSTDSSRFPKVLLNLIYIYILFSFKMHTSRFKSLDSESRLHLYRETWLLQLPWNGENQLPDIGQVFSDWEKKLYTPFLFIKIISNSLWLQKSGLSNRMLHCLMRRVTGCNSKIFQNTFMTDKIDIDAVYPKKT